MIPSNVLSKPPSWDWNARFPNYENLKMHPPQKKKRKKSYNKNKRHIRSFEHFVGCLPGFHMVLALFLVGRKEQKPATNSPAHHRRRKGWETAPHFVPSQTHSAELFQSRPELVTVGGWTNGPPGKRRNPYHVFVKATGKCWVLAVSSWWEFTAKLVFQPIWKILPFVETKTDPTRFLLRITGWWFQPIWKILVKLDHFPK